MIIHIIVAMTRERVIGNTHGIPWDISEERQIFKELTLGHPVIMGLRTYHTIGYPLENRLNIVLSSELQDIAGVQVCNSISDALKLAATHGTDVYVIGGADVYAQTLPVADMLHISWIHGTYPGTTLFPEYNPSDWKLIQKKDFSGFRYEQYQRATLKNKS